MLKKSLIIFVLFLPLLAHAQTTMDVSKYVVGKWKVEAVKKADSTVFKPPKHPMKWEFTANGKLIEELGTHGAKVEWHYHVVGHEIKVQLGNMAFSWKVLSMSPKDMLIEHQLGVLKVVRM